MDIKYVAAAPGMGKTLSAIRYMRDHLERIEAGEPVGTIFYVAPSKNLLRQTWTGLERALRKSDPALIRRCKYIVGSKLKKAQPVPSRVYDHMDAHPASIVFLTHMGFLTLRTHPRFAETTVVFDETRVWVTPVSNIKLDAATHSLFRALFRTERIGEGSLCTVAANEVNIAEIRKSLGFLGGDRAYSALLNFHRLISTDHKYGEPRVSAYGAMRKNKDDTHTLVKVEVPYLPFRGFRDVIVLSARFKSSQMFHLLYHDLTRNPTDRLVDDTVPFLTKWMPDFRSVSLRVAQRYREVVIVPLLGNDDRVLSMTALEQGFIAKHVPKRSDANWFKGALEELRDAESTNNPDAKSNSLRVSYGATTRIMDWMLSAALYIHKKWSEKYPCNELPLVFTNHEEQKQEFDFFPQKRKMVWVNHANSRGSNDYMESNAVFYLTAVNAHPVVADVLDMLAVSKRRLPPGVNQYDSNQDYVVDSALQCLGRGCVRDHSSPERKPMLVVVPTVQLAEYLKAALTVRLNGGKKVEFSPTVDYRFVEKIGMSLQTTVALNSRPLKKGSLFLTKDETKRLDAIKTQKSRAKKAGDTAKYNRLESERIAIRTAAAQREDASAPTSEQ